MRYACEAARRADIVAAAGYAAVIPHAVHAAAARRHSRYAAAFETKRHDVRPVVLSSVDMRCASAADWLPVLPSSATF